MKNNKFYEMEGIPLNPNEIIVSLTSACNLRCSYCFHHKRKPVMMSKETASNIIKFALNSDEGVSRVINLYGGEPTLNLDAMEQLLITYKEMKIKGNTNSLYFYINTNGYEISDRFINLIKEFRKVATFEFVLSLNGTKESHDSVRIDYKGYPTYDTIINNVIKLKKEIPDIYIDAHAVADKKFVSNFYENCKSMLSNPLFTKCSFELAYYGTDEEYTYEEIENIYNSYKILKTEFDEDIVYEMFEEIFKVDNYKNLKNGDIRICEAGHLIMCIDPKGNLIPCDFYLSMKDYSEFILCNINDTQRPTYNNKWEKYRKANLKHILGYTECKNSNGDICTNCDCNVNCVVCTGMTEYFGEYLTVPLGQCNRTKNISNIFKKLKMTN